MKPTVCVDLDGVLADNRQPWQGLDHFGDVLPGAVEFTRQLSAFADVVIHTCRCTQAGPTTLAPHLLRKLVQEWLDQHGFAYADIWVGQGKPIASCYIDDRAVVCRPQVDPNAFDFALLSARLLSLPKH